ncbi:MAG TPA: PEP/pyruvate-binding domain-containing protein [Stackebrandtia sp.]|jgi:pyruvate,water dikinase|uniref:PEP/pyruvate-binding domain-containing protein n=1 Tax=Stackebrandtia sp. TaxID=2023065 RepID=UPI002D6C6049|nr:PEP/pyruvate-binding domain-containing protein [Stackebrandtia sp.]HZE40648.1 PEP/pyruvate-binding domain-containing protein [Stackebrandtia sp.]
MSTPLVMSFSDIADDDFDAVGGKTANLAILTKAGFPVPPGFCVTTAAYQRIAEAADVPGSLSGERLAATARERILAAAVPAELADAIRGLADGPVAVRSSATAEDLPYASFAGQQDTFLNVVGPEAVLEAVRRCWASLWTDRAVAYRDANDIDHARVRLAVVIQRMVDAEVAGVMFTANPVTGRRHQSVIDASPGLGEAVVSGAVNPDHFVVDADGAIVERRLGDKRLAIRPSPDGGTRTVETSAEQACLDDARIRALAELGARVEEHYGSPQDTEWAVDADGKLWLTQARPITTLYPLPDNMRPGLRAFFSLSVGQGLYRPITPMGMAVFRLLASGVARMARIPVPNPLDGPPVFAEAGQRLYIDTTPALRSSLGRAIVPRVLGVMESRSAVVLRGLMSREEFSVRSRSRWPALRRIARVLIRYAVPPHVVAAVISPRGALRRTERQLKALEANLTPPPLTTVDERLDYVERTLHERTMTLLPRIAPGPAAGFLMLGAAYRLLRGHIEPSELDAVLRGLPNNVTTEMDLRLWGLASDLRDDPGSRDALLSTPAAELAAHPDRLPPRLAAGLSDFLEAYGFRAVAEIDLGMPRWSDDPTHIIGVLANYLRLDDPALAPDLQFARGAAEAEDLIATLASRVGRVRGRLVRTALHRARLLMGLRELPKFGLVKTLGAMRSQLSRVGAELAAAGRLERADDVFFTTLTDLRGDADLRALVAERREDYARELRRRRLPRVLLSDGTDPEAIATTPAIDGQLTGTPASAGTVTATARVILDPVGAHLEPGEILVAPSTDPGWTPLFLTAGGLVMEMGGANSHGAVVAREYGIPAVVGVPDATSEIATGQRVTVDGTSGTVGFD